MKKFFDLQLFADGGEGGAGSGQGNNAGNGNGGQNAGTFSYAQAEEIANARAQRAERAALTSYFQQQGLSEEQITQAINDFKAQQAANKPNLDAITKERDDARAELTQLKNSQSLRKLGVRDDDADYVMFKVAALMKEDDKLDFSKAAAKFLKENPRFTTAGGYRVKTGTEGTGPGNGTGNGTSATGNAFINDAIRRAARR